MANYEFEPAGDCIDPAWCKLYKMCRRAGEIRGEQNPDLTGCSHDQAQQARQDMRDRFDLTKPPPKQP